MSFIRLFLLSILIMLFTLNSWARSSDFGGSLLQLGNATKRNYAKVLSDFSRSESLFQSDDFYTSVNWSATYFSAEYKQSLHHFLNSIYVIPEQASQKSFWPRGNEIEQFTVFFIRLYTYDYPRSDLLATKNAWELTLQCNEQILAPEFVHRFAKLSAMDSELFTYSNEWSAHYLVFFKKCEPPLQLILRGPLGQGLLKW